MEGKWKEGARGVWRGDRLGRDSEGGGVGRANGDRKWKDIGSRTLLLELLNYNY